MPRIPYPDPAKLSPTMRERLAQSPFNVARMMAGGSEPIFHGFSAFAGSLLVGSKLDPVLRELAILRVGYLCGSRYETFQHEAAGRHVGMTDAQFAAIKKGGTQSLLTDVQQAVLDFTDDVVKNVRAGDATLAAVRRHLGDSLVIDLLFVIGCYLMVSRLLETTGVELDQAPIDWSDQEKGMVARGDAG